MPYQEWSREQSGWSPNSSSKRSETTVKNDDEDMTSRLVRLETLFEQAEKNGASKSILGIPERVIIWLLIAAAATGNLPEVIAAIGKGALK
jgi:hypothetical protein